MHLIELPNISDVRDQAALEDSFPQTITCAKDTGKALYVIEGDGPCDIDGMARINSLAGVTRVCAITPVLDYDCSGRIASGFSAISDVIKQTADGAFPCRRSRAL